MSPSGLGAAEISNTRKLNEAMTEPPPPPPPLVNCLPLNVDNLDIRRASSSPCSGPSGSGKTTTLNMIVGFTEPTSGTDRAERQGHLPDAGAQAQLRHGLPELRALPPPHGGPERGLPAARTQGARRRDGQLVGAALDLVDLGGMGGRRPHELSGGQQQRVRAGPRRVFSPSVLLLDEPLSALDRKLRQSLQREIKRLHQELGLTFVFVTHDQDEAMTLSDRIAIFDHGRIVARRHPRRPVPPADDPVRGAVPGRVQRLRAAGTARQTSTSGTTASGRSREPGEDSEQQWLIVRPERMHIALDEASVPAGSNAAPAMVTDISFYGTYHRIELAFGDDSVGCAVLPIGAPVPSTRAARVVAHWRPEDQVLVSE